MSGLEELQHGWPALPVHRGDSLPARCRRHHSPVSAYSQAEPPLEPGTGTL